MLFKNRHRVATRDGICRGIWVGRVGAAQTLNEMPYRKFESLSLRQLGRSRLFSVRGCWQLSPVLAVIFDLSSGVLIGKVGSFFSERPIYLRSSGLRGFGTDLEIPTFRRAYEFQRKEVLRLLSESRERPIPIRHVQVRILPRQPGSPRFRELPSSDEKGPPNAGFSHRR